MSARRCLPIGTTLVSVSAAEQEWQLPRYVLDQLSSIRFYAKQMHRPIPKQVQITKKLNKTGQRYEYDVQTYDEGEL